MKHSLKKLCSILALIVLASPGLAQSPEKYVVQVKGLTCPFCAYGLEKKLKKVRGVQSVSIDLERDEAVVTAKAGEAIEEQDLREAVREAGFRVASLKKADPEQRASGKEEAPK